MAKSAELAEVHAAISNASRYFCEVLRGGFRESVEAHSEDVLSSSGNRFVAWIQGFSKMVELLGPQSRQMVELLGVKFAQKGLLLEIFAAPSAPRPILSFRTTIYIKCDHTQQLFSKHRHCRNIFTILTDFWKKFWNLDLKTLKKSLSLHFAHFFSKIGSITRIFVKAGRRSPPEAEFKGARGRLTPPPPQCAARGAKSTFAPPPPMFTEKMLKNRHVLLKLYQTCPFSLDYSKKAPLVPLH